MIKVKRQPNSGLTFEFDKDAIELILKIKIWIEHFVVAQFWTHLLDKIFEKIQKIAKNNKNPKKLYF